MDRRGFISLLGKSALAVGASWSLGEPITAAIIEHASKTSGLSPNTISGTYRSLLGIPYHCNDSSARGWLGLARLPIRGETGVGPSDGALRPRALG